MAESAPTITAVDYFAAGAEFHVQNSNTEETKQFVPFIGASGDYACSQEFDDGDAFMSEYRYCNAVPDIDTDLDTLLSTFGAVADAKCPTEIRIHFEAGEAATVTIDGHQHDDNPHVTLKNFDCSGIIPASSGVGVPTLITVAGTVSPVSADLTINANHVDKIGSDGGHFHGQNIGPCRVSLSVQYEGQVSGTTAGDWLNIIVAKSDDNQDTPTSTVTAEQFVDAN
ncbi:MAG: hypothetical protein ABIH03_08665 [Pseudomonadota bacterium]